MKYSRKFVVSLLLLAALFCGGAILGSHLPNISVYLAIAVTAIVATLLVLFGYTGHTEKKKKVASTQTKKKKNPSSETTIEEEGFDDLYSGR